MEKERRDANIHIRIEPSLKKAIEKEATEMGLDMRAYLLHLRASYYNFIKFLENSKDKLNNIDS